MPFIPVDETVRCALTFEDNAGNQAVNVLHFMRDESPVTIPDMLALTVVIESWLGSDWADYAATTWRAARIELLDLTAEDSLYMDTAVSVQGTVMTSPVPSWVTIAVSLRSVYSGRSRRGRLYHVGLTEGMTEGDYLTSGDATGLITRYENLLTQVQAADWIWCVVSYVSEGVPRVSGLRTPITSITLADRKLDRQVRRKP